MLLKKRISIIDAVFLEFFFYLNHLKFDLSWRIMLVLSVFKPHCSKLSSSHVHVPQKGCGYHLDLLVVSVMLGVCSVMGLPWFVAATVLSITHVNSLKVESGCSAPGEQPKFLGIREQRVTGFMIFMLMGCSVFMTSALKVSNEMMRQLLGDP